MTTRPWARDAALLPLHVLIATIGGFIVAFIAELILGAALSASGFKVTGSGLYDPLVWIPVSFLGFAMNRRLQSRFAWLPGIIVAAMFFLLLWYDVRLAERISYSRNVIAERYGGNPWRYEYAQLLAPDDRECGDSECLGKVFFTFPFFASIAYSIGAWFGIPTRKSDQPTPPAFIG